MHTEAFLPPTSDYSFKKSERLCSKKAFEFLFAKGKSVFVHPIKIIYGQEASPGQSKVQVGFAASKRNFKRAVKRNRLKRWMREAYRKHKFPERSDVSQYLMIMYIAKEIDNYQIVEESITKALNQIQARIEKTI